eukprot:6403124-Prymnesium_polylepis.1
MLRTCVGHTLRQGLGQAGRRLLGRSVWTGSLSVSYGMSRPVLVFTAGAPGSGKTFTLHQLYGLHNIEMIDLDTVMPMHPEYDERHPERLYDSKAAYQWANECVERRFQATLAEPREPETDRARFVCLDGTGTHVERQKRRMWEAKRAGFWVVQLYVKVSVGVCLQRNARRERSVPEETLRRYVEELDGAVQAVRAEDGLIDEIIEMDNEREDDHTSEQDRWGKHYAYIRELSLKHQAIFDGKDPFYDSMSAW